MSQTLNIELQNRTTSDEVYAYVTGLALNNNNRPFLLQADGKSPYYPESPPSTVHPLSADCAIRLGKQGSTTTATIPLIAGGRIWFSIGKKLTFFVNPGPALVEPSVTNPTDPNIDVNWAFCEFTFNQTQLYANISYVDFVSLPISMKLIPDRGEPQEIRGLKPDGLEIVCEGLKAQGAGWEKLVVESGGRNVRALSPNNGMVMTGGEAFKGHFEPYVDEAWEKYSKTPLTVHTQAEWGEVQGQVKNGELTFPGLGSFAKPSTADIFSCSTGPFANNAGATGPLTARISAALNRSTLICNDCHPTNEKISEYYKHPITNHYARLVHEANHDGRGYAFPYDDVSSGREVDQSGFVSGWPKAFSVAIG
ncbi:glucanase B protein [Rutstroemia sp. NJR-2017a WRK4]|nr:glucanase B protein [Rutstroemia sp. NJR-2017a WRK4]